MKTIRLNNLINKGINKEDFASQNIDLKFIQMGDLEVDNKYASILDLLFRYDKEHLKEQLNKYQLI